MKTVLKTTTMACILAITTLSCNKNQEESNQDTTATEYDTYAELVFENVSDIADEAYSISEDPLKNGQNERVFLSECVLVTLDLSKDPMLLIIDFTEEGCLCKDGRYRRGKIIVAFNGPYREEGTLITHSFEDYYVDNNQVTGSKTMKNMGLNEADHPYFEMDVDGMIIMENGTNIQWQAERTREWAEGFETFILSDDVYLISGSASGSSSEGQSWERQILVPLRAELNCRWIVSGTSHMKPGGRPERLVDFGDGSCDGWITVTIEDQVILVRLR